jgi:hypothetical protein
MGLFRNLLIAGALSGAYITNPEELSFRQYISEEMKKKGIEQAAWTKDRKLVSRLRADDWDRENRLFFSTVSIPNERHIFIGAFGRWCHVLLPEKQPGK